MEKKEWLELRKKGIGGSDAATVMGLNPWKSPLDLWLEKTGEYVSEQEDNERMYWGSTLEDVVAKEFMLRTGYKVRRKNKILWHKEYPFMLANVDRMLVDFKAGLECKTAGHHTADDWADGVPEYHIPQVQHYMAVTDCPVWFVAVLIAGQEYRCYRVDYDKAYVKDMIQAEADFWRLVLDKTPPPIGGTKADTETVKKLYPVAADKAINLPFEAFELIQQYEQACAEEKMVQFLKDEAANRLKSMLGEAGQGTVYDRKVIWSNVTQKRFDSDALKKEQKDLYERYLKETSFRRFSIK